MSVKQFRQVGGLHPRRSVFDLSHEYKTTCDMGELIPILCQEMSPGDSFKFGTQIVTRFQPLVAPILHEVTLYTHYFFVPYRLLWDLWEQFVTGGEDGMDDSTPPVWIPLSDGEIQLGSLWDYFGFPIVAASSINSNNAPLDFPRRAYNLIYNEYYRDENLQAKYELFDSELKNRNWTKDYFTSSLPFQQKGIAPALPVTISPGSTIFDGSGVSINSPAAVNQGYLGLSDSSFQPSFTNTYSGNELATFKVWLNNNHLSGLTATTFDVADLRLAFQVQKWQERSARAGSRYTEALRAHFGVSPLDERLGRPEYCGGSKSPVIFSEVLQTSSSDATTPQGNMAGHGLSVSDAYAGRYYAQEFGLLMCIMSVMPTPAYQQGLNRQWSRRTKFDYLWPEFVNLSEQAVLNQEIYLQGTSADQDIFGYQGRYDELRYIPSQVTGHMRSTFDYWHLGRIFSAQPNLNSAFITCIPDKRIFAVQDEDGLLINIAHMIKAVRPLPNIAEPGLVDHH